MSAQKDSHAFLLAVDESVGILNDRKTQLTADQLFEAIMISNDGISSNQEHFTQQDPCSALHRLSGEASWVNQHHLSQFSLMFFS